MQKITEIQKQIYNHYLRAYRINNGKPFRPKRDFSNIETDDYIVSFLQKLESVFKTYPHFLNDRYFDAPYKIYKDANPFYDLKFYASSKGISTCIAYYNLLNSGTLKEQKPFIRESFKFITDFCIEKGIRLSDYIKYASVCRPDCLKHLKDHKISWYMLFIIPGFFELVRDMPSDEFELYFGTSIDMNRLYINYFSDTETQKDLKTIYVKIYYHIDNSLKNKQS